MFNKVISALIPLQGLFLLAARQRVRALSALATQSGVTQIAYNFSVPMIVTRVGGLPEIVPDGRVGFVCEPTADGIREAIERLYTGDALSHFAENFPAERKRFSWATMCDKLMEVWQKGR